MHLSSVKNSDTVKYEDMDSDLNENWKSINFCVTDLNIINRFRSKKMYPLANVAPPSQSNIFFIFIFFGERYAKQECIPVGYIPVADPGFSRGGA